MIEKKVSEIIAVWIDAGLFAQARWPEEWKRLKRPESGLTFRDSHRATSNCKREKRKQNKNCVVEGEKST